MRDLRAARLQPHVRGMNAPPRPVATPCIQVCVVDGESGLCLGCHRTLNEVATWSKLTDADRTRIMAELPARKSRIRPEKLGLLR
jgi:predicted Fe-S protein YdhL (DUF1289 family)